MIGGHFDFYHANKDGSIHSGPIPILTEVGVILQCHHSCNEADIRRLCEIARQTPDYPVDLTAWRETSEGKELTWSARIYWRQR